MKQVSTRELQRDGVATVLVMATLTLLKFGNHQGWTVAIATLVMAVIIVYIVITNRKLRQ